MSLCISLLPSCSRSILSRRWSIQLFESETVDGTSVSVSIVRANLVNRSWEDVSSQKESSSSRRSLAFSGSLWRFSRIAVISLMVTSRSYDLICFVLICGKSTYSNWKIQRNSLQNSSFTLFQQSINYLQKSMISFARCRVNDFQF